MAREIKIISPIDVVKSLTPKKKRKIPKTYRAKHRETGNYLVSQRCGGSSIVGKVFTSRGIKTVFSNSPYVKPEDYDFEEVEIVVKQRVHWGQF